MRPFDLEKETRSTNEKNTGPDVANESSSQAAPTVLAVVVRRVLEGVAAGAARIERLSAAPSVA